VRVLKEAGLIACEDTRHTSKLLNHYGIATPRSAIRNTMNGARGRLVLKMEQGTQRWRRFLMRHAGISDPGYRVIKLALARCDGSPVPGSSALIGRTGRERACPTDAFQFSWVFAGQVRQRRTALESFRDVEPTLWFMKRHTHPRSSARCGGNFGAEGPCHARELTKLHEEFIRGKRRPKSWPSWTNVN